MKTNKTDINRYMYEYSLYRSIEAYNMQNPKNVITTRMGGFLRSELGDRLGERSLGELSISEYKSHVNDIMRDAVDFEPFVDGGQDPMFMEHVNEFKLITGVERGSYDLDEENKFIPISPYDPTFKDRETILVHGKLLGAPVSGYEDISQLEAFDYKPEIVAQSIQLQNDNNGQMQVRSRDIGGLVTKNDISGVSKLMANMTKSEYTQTSAWVTDALLADADIDTRHAAIDKASYILQGLSDMGYDYTIKNGLTQGTASAVLSDSGIEIKLIDTAENARYIGEVRDRGASVSFSTTRYDKTGVISFTPSNEESLDLVRFALGEQMVGSTFNDSRTEVSSRYRGGTQYKYNNTFNTRGRLVTNYKPFSLDGVEDSFGNVVKITHSAEHKRRSVTPLDTELDARLALTSAIETATTNLTTDLSTPVAAIQEHLENGGTLETFDFPFSTEKEIETIQSMYVAALTIEDPQGDELAIAKLVDYVNSFADSDSEPFTYEGLEPSEKLARTIDLVNSHVEHYVDDTIGSYDLKQHGANTEPTRFSPVAVAKYQSTSHSIYKNRDDIINACKMLDIDPAELHGSGNYHEDIVSSLIKYDSESAVQMNEIDSEFMQSMYGVVAESLDSAGVVFDPKDILIDNNGIVSYSGLLATKEDTSSKSKVPVNGTIGQIFAPDLEGVVETKFLGDRNYEMVPGYEARIRSRKTGEMSSVEERTILVGYDLKMARSIRREVRDQLLMAKGNYVDMEANVALNKTYKTLYSERYDVGFRDRAYEEGMDKSLLDALIKTNKARVRYPNEVAQESTIAATHMADAYGNDLTNDNTTDMFIKTNGRNMAILTEEADGFFDPIATSATSTIQGSVRFLVEGAHVNLDGSITPSEDKKARCAIFNHEIAETMKYDPFDRQAMVLSNLMQSVSVAEKTNVAQMTFGGWNQDDGIVVSKQFAENNSIIGHDGSRDLRVGDKMSDMHGNKGVVSLVVDPDMDPAEAEAKGLTNEVAWFKANPGLDVVMAPFPAVSRFNGGTAREMMADSHDLINPETGEVIKGGVGSANLIITDKAADIKTHIYDESEVAAGNGRRFGAQLAMALCSKDANAIMREAYGRNDAAYTKLRECMIVAGLDLDEFGNMREGYAPHAGEERNIFELPDLQYRETKSGLRLNMKPMKDDFVRAIDHNGGFMEIPFPIELPTGEELAQNPETGHYLLPVLSSHLRAGQAFDDGSQSVHDFTNHYHAIFEESIKYQELAETTDIDSLTDGQLVEFNEALDKIERTVQNRYNTIANTIISKGFESKHNIFRDDLMSKRMGDSATAIWSEDPRLDVDQVAMSSDMADTLGLEDGDYTLVWRDPMLRDSGIRYMRVKRDPNIDGVAITPVAAKSFDGDFDGDSVAIVKLNTPSAQKEAYRLFSMEANLLDHGSKGKDGQFDLSFNNGLDVQVAAHNDPKIADTLAQIREDANKLELVEKSESESRGYNVKDMNYRRGMLNALSDTYRDAYSKSYGSATVTFDNIPDHLQSVHDACVETGAKGSASKVEDYMKYLGVSFANGKYDFTPDNLVDNKDTLSTRVDHEGTQTATIIKSVGTGIAGAYQQRGTKALRNVCEKEVLELTYPVTQGILQAKHDPVDAKKRYGLIMGPVRDLWKGANVELQNGEFKAVREGRDYAPCTREDWVKSFEQVYMSDEGLGVNINMDYVETISKALVDEKGFMRNLEEEAEVLGSPMDNMAYNGKFENLVDYAKQGANIYDGKQNGKFTPRKVVNNQMAHNDYYDGITDEMNLKRLTKGDTQMVRPKVVVEPEVQAPVTPDLEFSDITAMFNDGMDIDDIKSMVDDELYADYMKREREFNAAANVESKEIESGGMSL